MKLEAHILVIDLHPCDGEGEGLCRILQNSTLFTSVIRHVTPDAPFAAGQKQMLAACGVEFKPSIVFLVSSNTNTGLADLLTRTTEEFGCCVFAVVEVVSEPTDTVAHTSNPARWPWSVAVEALLVVPHLANAPPVEAIGVAARSMSQQSHISIRREHYERAVEAIASIAA